MHIHISLKDGVAIYRQIVNQVKYLVASGRLRPEEELPPIRELAKQLLVTPNTVVKAYSELEAEGVITKRQGAGTYVAPQCPRLAKRERKRILSERADALLVEAEQMDFPFEELLELLHDRYAHLHKN